jgi:hypothetical protein
MDQYGTHTKVAYTMPEYDTQLFSGILGKPYISITEEQAEILNPHMIKVRNHPLYVPIASNDNSGNLVVHKKTEDGMIPIQVENISFSEGIIILKGAVSENDNIVVNYTYMEEYFVYRGFWRDLMDFCRIDLNPNQYHTYSDMRLQPSETRPTTNLFNKTIYFFMRPTVEYAISSTNDDLLYGNIKTLNGHVYLPIEKYMTWKEAKAYCESLGGHLAMPKDVTVNNFIKELIKGLASKRFWLGATDEAVEGEWKWIDGSDMVYKNFPESQPDNAGGLEHYLEIANPSTLTHVTAENWWNDLPDASESIAMVCEWDNEDAVFNEVITENQNTLYHKIDDFMPDSDHDIYIGSVYIRQNTSLYSTVLIDTRTRGGGITESMKDSLRKELEPESDFYLDIGFYDGKPYQENGVIIVRLDNSILKEFGGKFTQQDIEEKVKKWLGYGIYPIIEYVDSYSKYDMPQYNLIVEDSYTNVIDETPDIILDCTTI